MFAAEYVPWILVGALFIVIIIDAVVKNNDIVDLKKRIFELEHHIANNKQKIIEVDNKIGDVFVYVETKLAKKADKWVPEPDEDWEEK